MNQVIYINNDTIHIIKGKLTKKDILKIKKEEIIQLSEGSVLNGVIINREGILEQLKAHKKILKNVTILLNSSNIIIKKMVLPVLSNKDTLEVVKKEFALLEKNEDFIYDFHTSLKGRKHTIIACGVPKQFVQSYVDLFEEAGIAIKSIDSVLNKVIQYAEAYPQFKDKNFVFNMIEKNTMVSLLFERGYYMFNNRNRMLHPEDTEDYGRELFTALSSMSQFHKAQKSPNQIEWSYYTGIQGGSLTTLNRLTTVVESGITAELFVPRDQITTEGFYMTLGLCQSQGNLLQALKRSKKNYLRDKKWFGKILNLSLLIAVIAVGFNNISNRNQALKDEITQIQNELISPEFIQSLNEVNDLKEEGEELDRINEQLTTVIESVASYKVIDGNKVASVYESAGNLITIEYVRYASESKSIEIKGTAKGVHETQHFITRLKDTGIFEDIDYSGYTNKGKDTYSFLAQATLKGGNQE